MSLEDRVKGGFELATAPAETDVALATLIATYHAQRRQRALLVVVTAVITLLVATGGGGALRWIQSLDLSVPPADRSESVPDREHRENPREFTEDSGLRAPRRDVAITRIYGGTSFDKRDTAIHAQDGEVAHGSTPRSQDEQAPATVNDDPDRDLTRVVPEEWSHGAGGNSGIAMFSATATEDLIRVKLDSEGGAGSSGLEAEVYEVVNGESTLLATICSWKTYSSFIGITSGADIEVRVSSSGCNGRDLNLKGTATVAFYEWK